MIVTATTNHLGNPEFTLINPGLGYQIGDTVLFYDPEFVIYGGGQTIPSAELVVSAQEKPKFISNFINFGDNSNIGFLSSGNLGDDSGAGGDGSSTL